MPSTAASSRYRQTTRGTTFYHSWNLCVSVAERETRPLSGTIPVVPAEHSKGFLSMSVLLTRHLPSTTILSTRPFLASRCASHSYYLPSIISHSKAGGPQCSRLDATLSGNFLYQSIALILHFTSQESSEHRQEVARFSSTL